MRMRRRLIVALVAGSLAISMSGCQKGIPKPGSISGYDEGEQYLSIWVHSIEDTEEGRCYRESVNAFNEAYNGQYFADIELFQETTAAVDIPIRLMHRLCREIFRMYLP